MRSAAGGWSRRGPRCSRELEAAGSLAPRPPRARLRAFIFNEEFLLPFRTPPRLLRTSLGSGRGGLPLLGLAASFWSSSLSLPHPVRFWWLLSFSCPSAQRHKAPSPRTGAHTLTSHQLGKEPIETLSVPPHHPGAFVRGLGGPRLPHTARDKNPGRSSPLLPGPSDICLAPAVCPALSSRGAGEGRGWGLGKAALCWKGKPDPWRGG